MFGSLVRGYLAIAVEGLQYVRWGGRWIASDVQQISPLNHSRGLNASLPKSHLGLHPGLCALMAPSGIINGFGDAMWEQSQTKQPCCGSLHPLPWCVAANSEDH